MIAQLYAQCIAVLILPRLPNVQIISTVQEAASHTWLSV